MQLDHQLTQSASEAVQTVKTAATSPLFIGGTGIAIFAGLAAIVVMLMTKPKDDKEFAVALISTLIFSVCGGAFLIVLAGFLKWLDQAHSTGQAVVVFMAYGGIIFSCGLPGWAIVRALFNTIKRNEGKTLGDVVHSAVETAKEVKGVV